MVCRGPLARYLAPEYGLFHSNQGRSLADDDVRTLHMLRWVLGKV